MNSAEMKLVSINGDVITASGTGILGTTYNAFWFKDVGYKYSRDSGTLFEMNDHKFKEGLLFYDSESPSDVTGYGYSSLQNYLDFDVRNAQGEKLTTFGALINNLFDDETTGSTYNGSYLFINENNQDMYFKYYGSLPN